MRNIRTARHAGSTKTALLAAAAFLLAGCISGEPNLIGPGDFQVDCATSDQPPAGSNQAVVRIRNFAFQPSQLTVDVGTEVIWVNCEGTGGAAHTTTSDDGIWASPLLSPEEGQYSRTFDQAGRFDYHCEPHPFMQAAVIVQ